MARRIVEGGYDLIVLNEIFEEGARRDIVARLASHFPYYVEYLGSSKPFRQDSGLMLFSRLPFEPLPRPTRLQTTGARASVDGGNTAWTEVAFLEFDACADVDCLAGKGVGYVRVQLGGRPLNVFFTHMQASYRRDDVRERLRKIRVRGRQLAQVSRLIRAVLGQRRAGSENVVVLGDFNVEGRLELRRRARFRNGPDEWSHMLRVLREETGVELMDLWDRFVPPSDQGATFPVPNPVNRFDYILLNAADPLMPLCVQHVSLAHNLRMPPTVLAGWLPEAIAADLSDHIGVNADINRATEACSLLDARAVGRHELGERVEGAIVQPGGVRWYRVDGPGTYVIGVDSASHDAGVVVEVFEPGDISHPARPLASVAPRTPGIFAARYQTGSESLLLRVSAAQRVWTGGFSLYIAESPGDDAP